MILFRFLHGCPFISHNQVWNILRRRQTRGVLREPNSYEFIYTDPPLEHERRTSMSRFIVNSQANHQEDRRGTRKTTGPCAAAGECFGQHHSSKAEWRWQNFGIWPCSSGRKLFL